MGPLVLTRDQGTVETVEFCSEEGEDCPICRIGDGHRFLDLQGVIYNDYLEKGQTVTGLYYAELLGQFAAELQKVRPHLVKKKVLFHHDNAPAHTSALEKAKLVELGYELLPHPPYSPDFAPCDFFLFPNLKKSLAGQKFASNEEDVAATEAYFADHESLHISISLWSL